MRHEPNIGLRLTLEFPTISFSSMSPFTLVFPSQAEAFHATSTPSLYRYSS